MHDIKEIRENPKKFDHALKRRGLKELSNEIIDLDLKKRNLISKLQGFQKEKNDCSKLIGSLKQKGQDASDLIQKVSEIKLQMPELDLEIEKYSNLISGKLLNTPNVLSDDVPDGLLEKDNKEIFNSNNTPRYEFGPFEHFDIGANLKMMDFENAANISGSRFVILKNDLAKLERAIINFMMDVHVNDHGYSEISPSHLVKEQSLIGTGQLPKFKEDLFKTNDDKWLIPTAEVPLTNMVMNKTLDVKDLPLRYVASSSCFRSEAGAAGKDTRGMIRVHEFKKVELVSIVLPEFSNNEHERLTKCATNILDKLGLSYRVMMLSAGDIGFSANKTYDLEVWLPGQANYREISSCSNCSDFQSRRMNAKFKDKVSGENKFLHTLNGSALAVGRTLVAILETFQTSDGRVKIPNVIQNYMGGQSYIEMEKNLE